MIEYSEDIVRTAVIFTDDFNIFVKQMEQLVQEGYVYHGEYEYDYENDDDEYQYAVEFIFRGKLDDIKQENKDNSVSTTIEDDYENEYKIQFDDTKLELIRNEKILIILDIDDGVITYLPSELLEDK